MHSPFEASRRVPSAAIEASLDQALMTLMTGDFQARWEVVGRVPALGEQAVGPLLELLGDETLDWEVRWFATRILATFDRPEVIAALMDLWVTATDPELRQGAADALTQIGPSAVMVLTQGLQQPEQRLMAAQALAQIRHRSTVAPLLGLVVDPSATLRALALEALAAYRDERVLPAVRRALVDGAESVRLVAVRALGSCRGELSEAALVELLTPRLQDGSLAVGEAAIATLGRLTPAAALLIPLLQTEDTPTSLRLAAIQALGWMGTEPALQGLLAAWPAASAPERAAIVVALTHQPTAALREQAATALLGWLQELRLGIAPLPGSESLAQDCALALGQLGSQAAQPTLQALLADADEGVQLHAIAALRQLVRP